jgi:thiamine biosynthesis protein ThiS
MFIVVNGKSHPCPRPQTLAALLLYLAPPAPFAVALNDAVIFRGGFEECWIYPGDRIDIIHPTAGG